MLSFGSFKIRLRLKEQIMNINLKRILLSILPLLFIFFVWLAFSNQYFIKDKVPFSSTYLVNFFSPWNAYPGFSSPVKNNAMPDIVTQIYPWKTITIDTLKNLQIPLWNPYSLSGTPLLANYQSAVLSPFNLLFFIMPFINAWSLLILLQPLLAGIFMYIFLRSLKITKEGSVLGSIAFMFCGFITTWMAYGTLSYAILFLPLSLFSIEKYYQTNKSRFLFLLALSFPLSFFSGHFQISLYFLIFTISYSIYKWVLVRDKRAFFNVLIYSVLGILFSLPQLIPSMELYLQSLRSGIFGKIEVIPWTYLPTFLSPDFFGNPVTRNDWFGHYAEWNAYIGIIPLVLAFYSIFRKITKTTVFFIFMAVLSIILSFQTPVLDLLVFLKLPVLSTSAVSRIIVIFSFSASVLAALGLDFLIEDIGQKKKYLLSTLSFFAIIFIFFWIIISLKIVIPLDKIVIARQNLILPTIIFALFVLVSLVGLFINKKIIRNLTILIILLLVSFDMLRFAIKWMPFDLRSLMYPKVPVVNGFKKISGYERVVSNLGGEATAYYKLPSMEGYDALYVKRYGEFIASLQNGDLKESARSVVSFPKNGLYTQKAVNLLGVKYIIYKISDGRSPWTFPFWNYTNGIFSLIYNDNIYQIFENKNALPRAFLVNKYIVEENPQKILDKMFNTGFDLSKEIVLEKNINKKIDSNSKNSVKITSYSSNVINISTQSSGNSLLFLSDTFYPGWEAYVDGVKEEVYRADFTFRGVFIPKGKHAVKFIYNPQSFNLGLKGGLLGVILILLIAVIGRRITSLPKI